MTKEMEFFIYLIEHYANFKGMNANDVVKKLDQLNLIQVIYDRYEFYHIESLDNAYNDIDKLISKKDI